MQLSVPRRFFKSFFVSGMPTATVKLASDWLGVDLLLDLTNHHLDGYNNVRSLHLGVIYDSQATNRKFGGLTVRAPTPIGNLGVIFGMNPASRNTQKHLPKQVETRTFWLKYCLQQHFDKTFTRYNSNTFSEE
jgi:hypothetical protein